MQVKDATSQIPEYFDGAVATMMVAAGLLAAWKALPGLLVGRLPSGSAVGLAAGSAITYLIELRLRSNRVHR